MNKDDDLLAHFEDTLQVLEDDIIHDIVATLCVTHLFDSIEDALQGCGPIRGVEAEGARTVSLNEFSDINVIGQSSRESNQSDRLLVFEACGEGSRYQAL